jgi:hypothetical protein
MAGKLAAFIAGLLLAAGIAYALRSWYHPTSHVHPVMQNGECVMQGVCQPIPWQVSAN